MSLMKTLPFKVKLTFDGFKIIKWFLTIMTNGINFLWRLKCVIYHTCNGRLHINYFILFNFSIINDSLLDVNANSLILIQRIKIVWTIFAYINSWKIHLCSRNFSWCIIRELSSQLTRILFQRLTRARFFFYVWNDCLILFLAL